MSDTPKPDRTRGSTEPKSKSTKPPSKRKPPKVGTGPAPDPEGAASGTMYYAEDDGWVAIPPTAYQSFLIQDSGASPSPTVMWIRPAFVPVAMIEDLGLNLASNMNSDGLTTLGYRLVSGMYINLGQLVANTNSTDLQALATALQPYLT